MESIRTPRQADELLLLLSKECVRAWFDVYKCGGISCSQFVEKIDELIEQLAPVKK